MIIGVDESSGSLNFWVEITGNGVHTRSAKWKTPLSLSPIPFIAHHRWVRCTSSGVRKDWKQSNTVVEKGQRQRNPGHSVRLWKPKINQ